MNRRYTIEEFKSVVKLLKTAFPEVVLTTDIIVGFPGETEKEFQETYEFLKQIKFYKMHIFQYSPRKGTKAEQMPNQIPKNIKEIRSKKLIELSNTNELERLKSEIGKIKDVLFEQREGEFQKGHTENYIEVIVKDNENLENKICSVKIQEIIDKKLFGEIIKHL